MDKKQFKDFFKKYLIQHNFEKIKNKYYYKHDDFLCRIELNKSNYGEFYYIEYDFYIGNFTKPYLIDQSGWQTATPFVGARFGFGVNKDRCIYGDYNEDLLKQLLDQNMERAILPPFERGKKFLLDNFGKYYTTYLDEDEIKKLLLKE